MTTPTTAELLKYAGLQMAKWAFLSNENGSPKTGKELKKALNDGNKHPSKFTELQAIEFEKNWQVVDQCANTPTGFSGTLFRNKDTEELILSFRSTEFIDDSARDNQATNAIKIKETGFARDQIRNMQAWYQAMTTPSGHLATAFNTLYAVAREIFTFNGAGISRVDSGTTLNALDQGSQQSSQPKTIKSIAAQACKTRASGRFKPKNIACKALTANVQGAAR